MLSDLSNIVLPFCLWLVFFFFLIPIAQHVGPTSSSNSGQVKFLHHSGTLNIDSIAYDEDQQTEEKAGQWIYAFMSYIKFKYVALCGECSDVCGDMNEKQVN